MNICTSRDAVAAKNCLLCELLCCQAFVEAKQMERKDKMFLQNKKKLNMLAKLKLVGVNRV